MRKMKLNSSATITLAMPRIGVGIVMASLQTRMIAESAARPQLAPRVGALDPLNWTDLAQNRPQ